MGPPKPPGLSGPELWRASRTQLRDLMEGLATEYQHVITARFNQQTGVCAVVEEIGKGPKSRKIVMLNSGFRTEKAVAPGSKLVQQGPFRQTIGGRTVTYIVTEAGTRIEYDAGVITAVETVKGERTVYEKALGLATYVEETVGGPPVEITIGVNEHHAEMRLLNWAGKRFKILAVAPTRGCCADCNRRLCAALDGDFENAVPESRRTRGNYRKFEKQFRSLLKRADTMARQGQVRDALKVEPAAAERFLQRSPAGGLPVQREQIRRALARFRISDTKLLRISKFLKVAGPAMVVFDAMTTYARAAEQWERGARDGAAETLAEFGGRMAGAYVGAESFGLMFGALGSVVPGVGTTVGALAGAVLGGALGAWAGEQEVKELCHRITEWSHGGHDAKPASAAEVSAAAGRFAPFSAPSVIQLERHMYHCGYSRPEVRFVCEMVQGSLAGHPGGGSAPVAAVLERAGAGLPSQPGGAVEDYPWPVFVSDGYVSTPDDLVGAPGDERAFDLPSGEAAAEAEEPHAGSGALGATGRLDGLGGSGEADGGVLGIVETVTGEVRQHLGETAFQVPGGVDPIAPDAGSGHGDDPGGPERGGVGAVGGGGGRAEDPAEPEADRRSGEAAGGLGHRGEPEAPPDPSADMSRARAEVSGSIIAPHDEADGVQALDGAVGPAGPPASARTEPAARARLGDVTDPAPAGDLGQPHGPVGRESSPDLGGDALAEQRASAEVTGSAVAPHGDVEAERADDRVAVRSVDTPSRPTERAAEAHPGETTDPAPAGGLGRQSDPGGREAPPEQSIDGSAEQRASAEVTGSVIAPHGDVEVERADAAACSDDPASTSTPASAETRSNDVIVPAAASESGQQRDPVDHEASSDRGSDTSGEPQASAEVAGIVIAPQGDAGTERAGSPVAGVDDPAFPPTATEAHPVDVTDPASAGETGQQTGPAYRESLADRGGDASVERSALAEVSGSVIASHEAERANDGAVAEDVASMPPQPSAAIHPGDIDGVGLANDAGQQSDSAGREDPLEQGADASSETRTSAEVSGVIIASHDAAEGGPADRAAVAANGDLGSTPAASATETHPGDFTDRPPAGDTGRQGDPADRERPAGRVGDAAAEPEASAEVSGSVIAPHDPAEGERANDGAVATTGDPASAAAASAPEALSGDVTQPAPAGEMGQQSDPADRESPAAGGDDTSAEPQASAEVSGTIIASHDFAEGERANDGAVAMGSDPASAAAALASEAHSGDVTGPALAGETGQQSDPADREDPAAGGDDTSAEPQASAEVSGTIIASHDFAEGERANDGAVAMSSDPAPASAASAPETYSSDVTGPALAGGTGQQSDPADHESPAGRGDDTSAEPPASAEVSGTIIASHDPAEGERANDGGVAMSSDPASAAAALASEAHSGDVTGPALAGETGQQSEPADREGPVDQFGDASAGPPASAEVSGSLIAPDGAAEGEQAGGGAVAANDDPVSTPMEPATETSSDEVTDSLFADDPADDEGLTDRGGDTSAEPESAAGRTSLDEGSDEGAAISGDDGAAPAGDDADVELDVSAALASPAHGSADDAVANRPGEAGLDARKDDPGRGDAQTAQETDEAVDLLEPADDPADDANDDDAADADDDEDDDADDAEDEDDDLDADDDIVDAADDEAGDLDGEQEGDDEDDAPDAEDDDDPDDDDLEDDDDSEDDDEPEDDALEEDDPEEGDPEGGPDDDNPEEDDPEEDDGAAPDGDDDEEPADDQEEDPEDEQSSEDDGEDGQAEGEEEPGFDQNDQFEPDPEEPEEDEGEDRQGGGGYDQNDPNSDDDSDDEDESGGSGSGGGGSAGGGGSGWGGGSDDEE